MKTIINQIEELTMKLTRMQVDNTTRSREKACAITHMEEAGMWLKKEFLEGVKQNG